MSNELPSYSYLRLTWHGDVLLITLADPETMNAASLEMVEELLDALYRLELGILSARAVVLTGEGRGFCSGAHLGKGKSAVAVAPDGLRDGGRPIETHYNPLVMRLRDIAVPLVTAVNGAAAGVGSSIALMGDLIVASESAYFYQSFRNIGLVPDGGATFMLPRIVGRARAAEMVLLGGKLPAAKALEWGLVNRCVPDGDLMSTALGIATELAAGPASLGLTRRLLWAGQDADWGEQLDSERRAQQTASNTYDAEEGIQAFQERRPARFEGR